MKKMILLSLFLLAVPQGATAMDEEPTRDTPQQGSDSPKQSKPLKALLANLSYKKMYCLLVSLLVVGGAAFTNESNTLEQCNLCAKERIFDFSGEGIDEHLQRVCCPSWENALKEHSYPLWKETQDRTQAFFDSFDVGFNERLRTYFEKNN